MGFGYGYTPVIRAQENLAKTLRGMGSIGDAKYRAGLLDLEKAKLQSEYPLKRLQRKSLERKGLIEDIQLGRLQREEARTQRPATIKDMAGLVPRDTGPIVGGHMVTVGPKAILETLGWRSNEQGEIIDDSGEKVPLEEFGRHSGTMVRLVSVKTDRLQNIKDKMAEMELSGAKGTPEYAQLKAEEKAIKDDPMPYLEKQLSKALDTKAFLADKGLPTSVADAEVTRWQDRINKEHDRRLVKLKGKEARKTAKAEVKAKGVVPGYVQEAFDTVRSLGKSAGVKDDVLAGIAAYEEDPGKAAEKMAILNAFLGEKEMDAKTRAAYDKALTVVDAYLGQYIKEPKELPKGKVKGPKGEPPPRKPGESIKAYLQRIGKT